MDHGILDAGQAHQRLRRQMRGLARTTCRMQSLQAEYDAQVDALRRRYGARLASLHDRAAALSDALESLCRGPAGCLFLSGRKSLTTPQGEVGFRRCEPAVRLADGVDDEEAVRRLRCAGLADLVRARSAPDKRALRKAVREGRVDIEVLRGCGLELAAAPDRFYCRIRHEPAPTPIGAHGEGR